MSLADKVEQLTDIRDSMREKLVAKGVDASTYNFANFPEGIENMEGTSSNFFKTKFSYGNDTTVCLFNVDIEEVI